MSALLSPGHAFWTTFLPLFLCVHFFSVMLTLFVFLEGWNQNAMTWLLIQVLWTAVMGSFVYFLFCRFFSVYKALHSKDDPTARFGRQSRFAAYGAFSVLVYFVAASLSFLFVQPRLSYIHLSDAPVSPAPILLPSVRAGRANDPLTAFLKGLDRILERGMIDEVASGYALTYGKAESKLIDALNARLSAGKTAELRTFLRQNRGQFQKAGTSWKQAAKEIRALPVPKPISASDRKRVIELQKTSAMVMEAKADQAQLWIHYGDTGRFADIEKIIAYDKPIMLFGKVRNDLGKALSAAH